MRRKKISFLGQISAIVIAIGFMLLAPLQQAFGSAWTGNIGYFYGYFSNTNTLTRGVLDPGICDGGQVRGYILPVISNCYALPVDTINSAASFVGLLQNYNTNGDLREKTGSAFIVQTMLGRSGSEANANGGITISAADWTTLSSRLTDLDAAGEIDWNTSARASTNVYMRAPGNGGSYDAARQNLGQVGPAIVFKNYSGVPVYALFRECANPDGDLSGPIPNLDYGLTPTITADRARDSVVSPGDAVMVSPTVTNSGTTASPKADWQLSRLIIPAGGSYPTGVQTSNQPPQGFYGSLMTSGSNLASGNQAFIPGVTSVGQGQQTIPADAAGNSKVCYVLSVHPFAAGSNQWRHSDPYCFVLGKKPTVQIWGGDLRVGAPFIGSSPRSASVQTSLTTSATGTYGSWTEYGILAPSAVTGMASLSGLAGPTGNSSSAQRDWSKLTFANVVTDSCSLGFGCYNNATSMGTIPDVEGRFFGPGDPTSPLGANTSIGSLNQSIGVHVYTHSGDLVITGGTVQKGQSYVIRATGTVTISGDIHYTNAKLNSLTDIPQLIIIGQNIKIADTVTNIDAWLIAEGNTDGSNGVLDTCGVMNGTVNNDDTTALTTTMCNAPLTVNGPVMAQKLWLRRTGGDGQASAEVLNMRADAYLWAFTQAKSSGKAITTYTKELPPLF